MEALHIIEEGGEGDLNLITKNILHQPPRNADQDLCEVMSLHYEQPGTSVTADTVGNLSSPWQIKKQSSANISNS